MGRRTMLVMALAVIGALVVGGVLLASEPARAATPAIEVSRDGVIWSAAIATPLFGDALLVPAGSATRAFFIRNNAPEAGFLRLTLRDVSTDNPDYADALRLRADLLGWPGEAVAVSSAHPCARLAEGPVIASGGTTRVDVTALLGQLDGLHGQNGHVGFQIVISVSGEPLGLGTSGCPTSGEEVAGMSPETSGGHRFSSVPSASRYEPTASGWTRSTTSGTTTTPLPADPGPGSDPAIPVVRVASNTDRFYQEYDVALWLLGALLGAAAVWVLRRRPHHAAPERGTHPKGALR